MSEDPLYKNIRLAIIIKKIFNELEISYSTSIDAICTFLAIDYHVGDLDEEDIRHIFTLINHIKNKIDAISKEADSIASE